MEKLMHKLLEEGANIGEKYLLTAVLQRHWKKVALAVGVFVYAIKALLKALPAHLEQLERTLSEYPFVVVVFLMLCLWWIAGKALETVKR